MSLVAHADMGGHPGLIDDRVACWPTARGQVVTCLDSMVDVGQGSLADKLPEVGIADAAATGPNDVPTWA